MLHRRRPVLFEPVSTLIAVAALIEGAVGVAGTIGAIGIGSTTVGNILIGLTLSIGLSAVGAAYQKSQARKAAAAARAGLASQAAEYRTPARTGSTPRLLGLGEVVKSGQVLFEETKGAYYYLTLGLLAYEVDGLIGIQNNNQIIPIDGQGYAINPPYNTGSRIYLRTSFRKGTTDQEIDPIIAVDWPTKERSWRQRGIPTLTIKMFRGEDGAEADSVWGQNQFNPLARMRTSKVFDARDPTQNPYKPETHKYSRNAQLNYMHWRTHRDFGRTPWSEVDFQVMKEGADICDRVITRADGTQEPLYSIDGIVASTDDPARTERDLLLSFLATRSTVEGKVVVRPGAPVDRKHWRTFTDGSIRESIEGSRIPAWADTINTVRTSFVSRDAEYRVVDGPVYHSNEYLEAYEQWKLDFQTWLAAANFSIPAPRPPEEKSTDIPLPFVSSVRQVQYISKHLIERSKLGATVRAGFDIRMFRHTPGDIINLQLSDDLQELSDLYELQRIGRAARFDQFRGELLQYDPVKLYGFSRSDERPWSN